MQEGREKSGGGEHAYRNPKGDTDPGNRGSKASKGFKPFVTREKSKKKKKKQTNKNR